jgi:hypothetical protein
MLRRRCLALATAALTTAALAAASPATALAGSYGGPGTGRGADGSGVTFQNWAGYAATETQYTSVSANWTAPTVACTTGVQQSAFWVGFDGFETDSVEQTGTSANCKDGTAKYFAWYEMYPDKQVNYHNVVDPGDHMKASVTYDSGTDFTLVITDATRHWSKTATVSVSGDLRESAEAIAEAPCCTKAGDFEPLADFGTVSFSDVMVDGVPIGTLSPTAITMVDNGGKVRASVSALTGNDAFSSTWVRRD